VITIGIAETQDRYKYLEERIKDEGGVDHLEESEEWFQLESTDDSGLFDHPHWDKYMHRTRYFTASVHYNVEEAGDRDEAYETEATGEDRSHSNMVRTGVSRIQVHLIRPRHHYDYDYDTDEGYLPPIHETYTVDPGKHE